MGQAIDDPYLLGDRFVASLSLEFTELQSLRNVDLTQPEVAEVVGALVARQVTLARGLAESPRAWNYDIGPLILRAMADVHISLAWILGDPMLRARGFVQYGLGQAKLELEHRKADAEGRKASVGEQALIEGLDRWITMQRYPFLTEVNVGAWAGLSTRKMAEEAGLLHFYNYVYQPWSACTHSTWRHVGPRNLEPCENPLHRYHRVPALSQSECDASLLYLAAKYAEKTLRLCKETLGLRTASPNAFQQLIADLDVGDVAEQHGD